VKIYGAGIFCSICHAEPFPDDPATIRETFDLLRVNGEWFCEQHRPSEKEKKKAQGGSKAAREDGEPSS
jgi:hypothetical protein